MSNVTKIHCRGGFVRRREPRCLCWVLPGSTGHYFDASRSATATTLPLISQGHYTSQLRPLIGPDVYLSHLIGGGQARTCYYSLHSHIWQWLSAAVEPRPAVLFTFLLSTLPSPPFHRILSHNCLTRPRGILSRFLRDKTDHSSRKNRKVDGCTICHIISYLVLTTNGLIEILRSSTFLLI